jgi:type II pantothenate kinase
MGLVGENVALICAGLGRASGIKRLVYGGGALHDNPVLVSVLLGVSAGMGAEPVLLENGNFAGALGVLEAAATG